MALLRGRSLLEDDVSVVVCSSLAAVLPNGRAHFLLFCSVNVVLRQTGRWHFGEGFPDVVLCYRVLYRISELHSPFG